MPRRFEEAALQATEEFIAVRGPVCETHGQWARAFRDRFEGRLVAEHGALWEFEPVSKLYRELSLDHAAAWIGENWEGPKCRTLGDYRAIVQLTYDLLTRDQARPFSNAPRGVAAGMNFYGLDGPNIVPVPLAQEHAARFKLPCDPDPNHPAPLLTKLYDSSFPLSDSDSTEQRALINQHFGSALFGLAWRLQKAMLWQGPGSAGKSTFQKLLRALYPEPLVSAVPPHMWDSEYHAAGLAGKRLNLVGEIDDKKPLGATFKTVTGNDLLQARHPTHRPFSFVAEAAQVFNGNGLPPTTDRSEAFWRRWTIVDFRHKTAEADRDDLLAEKIIEQELPALLALAFDGARSLMASGKARYLVTARHKAVLARWQRQTNSVEEFLHDDEVCLLEADARTGRNELFEAYKAWCGDNRRHSFGRNGFRDQMLVVGPRAGVEEGRGESGSRVWTGVRIAF